MGCNYTIVYCLCGNALTGSLPSLDAIEPSTRVALDARNKWKKTKQNKCKTRKKNGIICKCRCPYICTHKMVRALHMGIGNRIFGSSWLEEQWRIFTKYNSNCRYNLIKYYPELFFFYSAFYSWFCVLCISIFRIFIIIIIVIVCFMPSPLDSSFSVFTAATTTTYCIAYCQRSVLNRSFGPFCIRCHCFASVERAWRGTEKCLQSFWTFGRILAVKFSIFAIFQVNYCASRESIDSSQKSTLEPLCSFLQSSRVAVACQRGS